MKKIYENFEEIANHFVEGESWTHRGGEHDQNPCFAWMDGAREFAKWLDTAGIKIIQNPEIYDKLWEEFRNISVCKQKNVKTKIMDTSLKERFEEQVLPLINEDIDKEETEAGECGRLNMDDFITDRCVSFIEKE